MYLITVLSCESDLDTDNYKDFAPTEHDLGLPNVQTAGGVAHNARKMSRVDGAYAAKDSGCRVRVCVAIVGPLCCMSPNRQPGRL